MKRMGAVESDSVKSLRKAKDKLHKACERALETRERTLQGQERNNVHGKHERVTRQCSVCNQNTSTITCTVAPRVWHFSAFHCIGSWGNTVKHEMWQTQMETEICVFRVHHRVWCSIALSFCWSWDSYALYRCIRYSCVYTLCMSPALSRSSAL